MISWPAYGGEDGLSICVRNGFPGLKTLDPIQFFALTFSLCAVLYIVTRLRASAFGLALGAARQNPERVRAVGIDPYRVQLLAFTISGAITGLAGALFADLNRFVSPVMFRWHTSGELIVFIILDEATEGLAPVIRQEIWAAIARLRGETGL